jgi:hypothetical protein
VPGLAGLLTPAFEVAEQPRLVHGELLERMTLKARNDGGDEPARMTHLDDSHERALGLEGGAASSWLV